MPFDLIARVLGGVGLFLLGMRLMTEGLRLAAGDALRTVLVRSTRTRLRGVASGALVTAIVQSSSAVTVATIGFVNAGLLTLEQAVAVTWGANVGTTATGWLVAAIGFHVDLRALSLPLIGLGMGLRLVSRHGAVGPIGEALAGFGLFFLGIDQLRAGFEGLGDEFVLGELAGGGLGRALLLVAIGFALTVLMQSSSAAIATILTAVGEGILPLGAGAALVIGANVGTTSTAALAVIGATPNARRVAAAHVAFNAITGAVAMALLPLLLVAIAAGREALRLDAEPVAVLAGFHTLFNLLGVALMWPLTGRLLRLLEARFRTQAEDEARPAYLDRHVLSTPVLAFDALALELTRVGRIARRLAGTALTGGRDAPRVVADGWPGLTALVDEVGEYVQLLQRSRLPGTLDELLPTALRVSRHYTEAGELAAQVAEGHARVAAADLASEVEHFTAAAAAIVERAGFEQAAYSAADVAKALAELEAGYHALKAALLEAGAHGRIPVHDLVGLLDWLSNVRRLVEQVERGTRFLSGMHPRAGGEEGAAAEA